MCVWTFVEVLQPKLLEIFKQNFVLFSSQYTDSELKNFLKRSSHGKYILDKQNLNTLFYSFTEEIVKFCTKRYIHKSCNFAFCSSKIWRFWLPPQIKPTDKIMRKSSCQNFDLFDFIFFVWQECTTSIVTT